MRAALLAVLAAFLLAPAAGADGGPSPGATTGWDGVLDPLGTVRYVALGSGGSTIVATVAVDGGRVVEYRRLAGAYGIPTVAYDGTAGGISADGSTLVLASYLAPLHPGQVTRFAVLQPDHRLRTKQVVTLRGAFSFDALSPDGRTLYLIEYRGAGRASTYRVRAYDLARGRLDPRVVADPREPGERMTGLPVARAATRDGGWAYTLYARPNGKPFVHALDTRHRSARCIDLPVRVAEQDSYQLRMRLAHGRLVVRESGRRVAAVDTRTFRVSRA